MPRCAAGRRRTCGRRPRPPRDSAPRRPACRRAASTSRAMPASASPVRRAAGRPDRSRRRRHGCRARKASCPWPSAAAAARKRGVLQDIGEIAGMIAVAIVHAVAYSIRGHGLCFNRGQRGTAWPRTNFNSSPETCHWGYFDSQLKPRCASSRATSPPSIACRAPTRSCPSRRSTCCPSTARSWASSSRISAGTS